MDFFLEKLQNAEKQKGREKAVAMRGFVAKKVCNNCNNL